MPERHHPAFYVQEFLKQDTHVRETELGIYTYVPRTINKPHEIHVTTPEELTDSFVTLQNSLQPGQEIAFHSRLRLETPEGMQWMHMPIVDFSTHSKGEAIDFCIRTQKYLKVSSNLLVNSGNSFHAYFPTFISNEAWEEFLWHCYNENGAVDTRWVPYQSIARYSSLRWSANTKPEPSIVTIISRNNNRHEF